MTQIVGVKRACASVVRPVVEDHMDITAIYDAYNDPTIGAEEFRCICVKQIEQSAGRNPTKIKFISDLQRHNNKSKLLFMVVNYHMAGLGLKV